MELDEAKTLLTQCKRWESRDHAFGDCEIGWILDGEEVASGYFGGGHSSVWIRTKKDDPGISFTGEEARELRKCGVLDKVGRNDTTGPDEYQEGVTMPGLTLEGVREELTGG